MTTTDTGLTYRSPIGSLMADSVKSSDDSTMTQILYRGATSLTATMWATDDFAAAEIYAADWEGDVYEIELPLGPIAEYADLSALGCDWLHEQVPQDYAAAADIARTAGYIAIHVLGDCTPDGRISHESWVIL